MKLLRNIIIALFCTAALNAQDSLSLTDAIVLGLQNNYDMKMMRNDEAISSINNTWGNTSFVPTLDLSASIRENWNFNNGNESYRDQTITPELKLNWVIFNGLSAIINKERFEDLEAQSKGNTAILVENTIQDIIMAYNNCLLQKELMVVYQELTQLSEDRYKRSKTSEEIGATTSYEGLQAKTSWLEDQSNYLQQKVTYENAIRTLNFLLGTDAAAMWTLTSELSVDALDYNIDDLKEKMTANNITLKNQYLYQSLLEKETRLAKSAYSPKLNLNSGISNNDFYSNNAMQPADRNSFNGYVGLTLSWNIFSGGTRKRGVEIAKINEESAQVRVEQMTHSLDNQLLQMYSTYNVNKAILALANEQQAAASLNMKISYEKFQSGAINSFNYRDVQVVYMNSSLSKLRAFTNMIQSSTDLLRITGGIVDEYEISLEEISAEDKEK